MKHRRPRSLYDRPSNYLKRKQKRIFWSAMLVGVILSIVVALGFFFVNRQRLH